MCIFSYYKHCYQIKYQKITMHDLQQRTKICGATPTPPLNEGLALTNLVFLSNQLYLSETLKTWSMSRNR